MKKSVTFKTFVSEAILLMALIPVLFISSCQKDEQIQPDLSPTLKSGVLTDGELVTYWEETFTRKAGKPEVITMKIGSEDLQHFEDCFMLKVKNGNEDGTNRISSGIIKVDGKEIFGTNDFNYEVDYLEKEVYGLSHESFVEVELRSKGESFISISLVGSLTPNSTIINSEGGIFEIIDKNNPLYGTKVEVSSNTFPDNTYITIK